MGRGGNLQHVLGQLSAKLRWAGGWSEVDQPRRNQSLSSVLPGRLGADAEAHGTISYFYRNWNSYARGFGDSANLWLGNDNLHALTSAGARLWVSLEDADNNWRYAEYKNFFVASALDYYQAIFEGYTGTAGDSLSYHTGQRFSTYDADHDSVL